jgi:hypothetical protein
MLTQLIEKGRKLFRNSPLIGRAFRKRTPRILAESRLERGETSAFFLRQFRRRAQDRQIPNDGDSFDQETSGTPDRRCRKL